jgi:non-reducing end alpha-L-arabinofuranosidase
LSGVGGDNSHAGTGRFFEGVMTAGVPSSSAMGNVQSDIVSVGYQGAPTLNDGVNYTFTNQASQMNLDN